MNGCLLKTHLFLSPLGPPCASLPKQDREHLHQHSKDIVVSPTAGGDQFRKRIMICTSTTTTPCKRDAAAATSPFQTLAMTAKKLPTKVAVYSCLVLLLHYTLPLPPFYFYMFFILFIL